MGFFVNFDSNSFVLLRYGDALSSIMVSGDFNHLAYLSDFTFLHWEQMRRLLLIDVTTNIMKKGIKNEAIKAIAILEGSAPLVDVQKTFHECFPYLKVEFYQLKNPGKQINSALKLQSLGGADDPVVIRFDKNQNISLLKQQFEKLGLGILIYRKAGKVWIETKLTEDWTLERQNEEGRLFSSL